MKALLYRRGGLGDTLLTFPIIEILKSRGYHITAVGNTDYFRIAREVGWADRVLSEIPNEDFDFKAVISIDGNLKPFPKERVWIVDYYLKSLGLERYRYSRELPLEPLENSPFRGKVVLHPSSGSPKKNPPVSLFLELETFLLGRGFEVVYLVGEADTWVKSEVRNYVESHNPLWIGKALKEAKLYVGLDSGISHLASYLEVPSVVIYGPTDPVVWKPIGKSVYQVSLNLECSPCFPEVCSDRECLNPSKLLESLFPLLDHLLV
ncbi:MAG: glycosyltransferase family 9 protein [Aquificae bacterium]|nr:glycosyltransferase family 9 protein [Aquificota bacterium]